LKYALGHTTGWKIVADNFRLRFEGDGITHGSVERAIVALSEGAFWDDLSAWQRILETMPVYRLSKFQPALPVQFQREMVGRYLLDLEGTRRFLTGDTSAGLRGAAELLRGALAGLEPAPVISVPEPEHARPERETRYIADAAALRALSYDLLAEPVVALDVETTLVDHELCLIQFGTPKYNALIDVLALDDLGPVIDVLESSRVLKVIHNAAFERSVFQRVNVDIVNVFDTLTVSRELRGRKIDGGHSLAAVCQRELGITLDKSAQTSDWRRRPLSARQQSYAALDVEVLLRLHERLSKELLFA
jgi:ATP-dependent Lhr-like helicase